MKRETIEQAEAILKRIDGKKRYIIFLKRIKRFEIKSAEEDISDPNWVTTNNYTRNVDIKPRRTGYSAPLDEIKEIDLLTALNNTEGDFEKDLVLLIDKHINKAELELKQLEAELEAL